MFSFGQFRLSYGDNPRIILAASNHELPRALSYQLGSHEEISR